MMIQISPTETSNLSATDLLGSMKTDRPWLGPLISICGNIIVSLSLNLQRLAHKKLDTAAGLDSQDGRELSQESAEKGSSYLRSGWWWAGMILMVIGETGNFLAYAFAP
jgi:hypothetical protein